MPNQNRKHLVVIGAGPKGIATAIKAKVLEEFGLPVDRVILIEKNNVAANWSGEFGYTNGEMKLGTSPEKDLVFPIEAELGDSDLNQRIHQRLLHFTWGSFLVHTSRFSDWVDRGRPAPCHLLWAEYIKWVSFQLAPQVNIISAHVTTIDLNANATKWVLKLKNSDEEIQADRLMLTGPGRTRLDFLDAQTIDLPKGVYDLESFWEALRNKSFKNHGRLAIIGAGENAASALLTLAQYAPGLRVDVISPKGFISTRAESFYENQMYSQPERNQWSSLELKDRIEFIERTDLGVFSVHAMSLLNEQVRHNIVRGRVTGLTAGPESIELKIEYGVESSYHKYDQVIVASGFDQVATLKTYLTANAIGHLEKQLGEPLAAFTLMKRIQSDLSLSGVTPSLHLPMLAGLAQGPGFANLSCLGRLSDRIVTLSTLDTMKTNQEPQKLALLGGL